MNMKRSKGYSLTEIAIVLVVISLIIPAFIGGLSIYRDRAEYYGNARGSELDELIAMDKRTPAEVEEAAEDPYVAPPAPPTMEDSDPEVVVVDTRPRWVRWLEWWRSWSRSRS